MVQAGATGAVLIFPMSKGNTATYDTELARRFDELAEWAEDLVSAESGVDWIVAGHSGAGRALAIILGERPDRVVAALLLDAAYNVTETKFASAWRSAKSGRAKIFNVYTPRAGTAENSRWLETVLGPTKFISRASITEDHCSVPRFEFGSLLGNL